MTQSSSPSTFRARYLFPADGPPIPDGTVQIDSGRLVAVADRHASGPAQDLGNVAILPALINAHVHLEFSDLTAPLGVPGMPFPDWLAAVVERRRQQTLDVAAEAVRRHHATEQGLAESVRHGVTVLGDVATPGWSADAYDRSAAQVTVFLELLGLAPDRLEPLWTEARQHAQAVGTRWQAGLSPHAPYTVRPELLQRVCRLSAERQLPVAMHLAESFEEQELLRSGSGPLVALLQSLEAWDPLAVPRGIQPLDYLKWLAEAHRALVIHGNYLTGEELRFLASHAGVMSLVYCPRTHAYFRHGRYPLAEALAAGVNVALGTDSRASSPDLSLLEDLRAAYFLHPDVPPRDILRLGTAAAAKALGLDGVTGDLRPGLRADFVVVPLPDRDAADPYELLFESDADVAGVCLRGEAAGPLA
jgi:cytosine/adenosine deaminase-related metal-dependent hydrolase